ncbi:AAC(3) family N-acetyltransferase [Streptomyces yaizuensis]|uniref:AAC(3) family N-acetyltransferase n=1 Tax=Streptomyces yaizuensis TaxID=2989713 RepID=A0ABQ5NS60_9ACTN|nr:AAC(3) family N-acetyltransferase [Streptomyces sp. YSPA8]GLF93209.1 AAC(3) family N-acetyltransferase [Streptomyces sp. YSPA8]
MTITAEHLGRAVDELGLAGRPVLVHAALRSFGEPLDGGADALTDALVDRGCTVLVPAFTEPHFGVAPPPSPPMRPARNGIDYSRPWPREPLAAPDVYTPGCGLVNPHLGAFPAALVARPGVHRGGHPLNSFAAVGPDAAALVRDQSPVDVYAPLRALAERDGRSLLIGVGLNRMTVLHLAEQQSGRRLFRRWARTGDGRTALVEVGSCSEGFPRLEPLLRARARTTTVGAARWLAHPVREVLAAVAPVLAAEPGLTRCSAECLACAHAASGGPVETVPLG